MLCEVTFKFVDSNDTVSLVAASRSSLLCLINMLEDNDKVEAFTIAHFGHKCVDMYYDFGFGMSDKFVTKFTWSNNT